MLKILKELWGLNSQRLYNEIANLTDEQIYDLKYLDLVKMTFKHIYPRINTKRITEIDDGDYQGTLIYVMPLEDYQPSASDYLLTCIGYGSCSVCDALQRIIYEDTREEQKKDLLTLCRDMVVETVKPYNYGWRMDEDFDIVDDFNDNKEG
jgi:hypothetical protein